MTLNDLERQFTALSVDSLMRAVTKWLRLESRGYRYKVAVYLSYVHCKFDDKIGRESLRILSINVDYLASKVKLTSRFTLSAARFRIY